MPIEEEHFHNQKKFMNSIDKELIATKKLSNILILEDIRNMKNIWYVKRESAYDLKKVKMYQDNL